MNRKLIRRLIVLAVLLVVVAVIPSLVSAPWLVILVQVLIISIATLALTVLAGYGGQFSIASAGLFATGAGVLGWLINTVQLPTPLALLGAILGGALVGLLVGLPALRLRGLYLMLSTLAANFILIFLFSKYASNFGEYGLTFAPLEFLGAAVETDTQWFYLLSVVVILVGIFVTNLRETGFGRSLLAIKQNEVSAAAAGIEWPG